MEKEKLEIIKKEWERIKNEQKRLNIKIGTLLSIVEYNLPTNPSK